MDGEWPTCTARVELTALDGFVLDCVLPKGHRFDGTDEHLTSPQGLSSAQVRWSFDMSILELEVVRPDRF